MKKQGNKGSITIWILLILAGMYVFSEDENREPTHTPQNLPLSEQTVSSKTQEHVSDAIQVKPAAPTEKKSTTPESEEKSETGKKLDDETLYIIAPSGLTLRSEPSTSSTRLNTYEYARVVTVLERQNDWVRVLVRGQTGWMHANYLAPNKPVTATAPRDALAPNRKSLNRTQIIKRLIAGSIEAYSGRCPCPYNRDRAGRRCGRRSAYSRPGGASPKCYSRDITPRMIKQFQAAN